MNAPAVRWRATEDDGTVHGFTTKQGPALCGAANQEERFDYGHGVRCRTCRDLESAERGGHQRRRANPKAGRL